MSRRPGLGARSVGRISGVLLAAALALVGCTPGRAGEDRQPSGQVVEGRQLDFIGEVREVLFAPTWAMSPPGIALAPGGPDGPALVGPQTLVLGDGRRLDVPTGTPGGNTCLVLIHGSRAATITGEPSASVDDVPRFETNRDWTVPCIVAGQRNESSGAVAWFAVLEVVDLDGRDLAELGIVDRIDPTTATVVTTDGYQLPTEVAETDCGAALDASPGVMALADPASGRVVTLTCLGDG